MTSIFSALEGNLLSPDLQKVIVLLWLLWLFVNFTMVQLVLLWGGGGIPWCQMNKRNAQGLARGLAVLILIGVSEKKNPYFDSILRTKLFIQKKFLITERVYYCFKPLFWTRFHMKNNIKLHSTY